MKKGIIFGCGQIGLAAYYKLCSDYTIIAWTDNNQKLWGHRKEGISILAPSEALRLVNEDVTLFVAVLKSKDVVNQIISCGVTNYRIWDGFFFDNEIKPCEIIKVSENNQYNPKKVLFVQNTACVRTHKIAAGLRRLGCKVYLAYSMVPPQKTNPEYKDIYEDIIPILSPEYLCDLVKMNSFDYIHSSNEPDYLTAVLINSSKPVIHDCHDLSSAYMEMSAKKLSMEYFVYTKSAGVIFTSEEIRCNAIRQYGLLPDQSFVLKNYISEDLSPSHYMDKLSDKDGKIHCVYEGGIISNDKNSHRYLHDIFNKIADADIQVHFYSQADPTYCRSLEKNPNIHYEGNKTSKELSVEMTKYDLGICILNVTDQNKLYLEAASPNKISEYINAGIPVAVGDIDSQRSFVEDYGFGMQVSLEKDILNQFQIIKKIKIEKNALGLRGLTMESQIGGLLDFYEKCCNKA